MVVLEVNSTNIAGPINWGALAKLANLRVGGGLACVRQADLCLLVCAPEPGRPRWLPRRWRRSAGMQRVELCGTVFIHAAP